MKSNQRLRVCLTFLFVLFSLSLYSAGNCWKVTGWQPGMGKYADAQYAVLIPVDCRSTETGYGWYDVDMTRAEIPAFQILHLMIGRSDPQMHYVDGETLILEGMTDRQVPIIRYDDYMYLGHGYRFLYNSPPQRAMCGCIPIDDSLVAWFPLDETSGDIAYNISGPNDGFLRNGPQHVSAGKVDYALQLDGDDDYIEVPHHPRVDMGTGDFSIEAWIKTADLYGNIVSKRHQHNSPGYLFMVYSGRLLLQMTDDIHGWFNYYSSSSKTVNDNQWHHVAVTVDRDNTQGGKMYVDGVVVYTFNPTNRQGSLDTGADMWIGQEGGGGQYYNGIIDELSLYKEALEGDQIIDIYNAGAYGKCKPDPSADPLSLSMKVKRARKTINAVARAYGGTGNYSFDWDCSLNLKLVDVRTGKKFSRAKFERLQNNSWQSSPSWVEVIVTDTLTGKTITERK
jgi:hypothetical protein